jgi:peptidoglycan/LPS O-acetylase OafA/YrhL
MTLLVANGRNNFNTLRMAMALLVIWSHSFALYLGTEEREPIALLTSGALDAGKLAVEVFFIMSGFLILKSFDSSTSVWIYLRKRVLRIYPAYLVAIGICAFVMLPMISNARYTVETIVELMWRNALLQGWFPDSTAFAKNHQQEVNGALWSILYEFYCYLGVLLLGTYAALRARRLIVLTAFVLLVTLDAWTLHTGKLWGARVITDLVGWPNTWLRMAPCFLSGMLVYLYRDSISRSGLLACAALPALLIGARWAPWSVSFLVPLCLGYLTFFAAFARPIFDAARYGDFSYGTYLYAWPIQQLLFAYGALNFPQFVGTAMLLSVLAGMASWFAVERWLVRPIKKSLLVPRLVTDS